MRGGRAPVALVVVWTILLLVGLASPALAVTVELRGGAAPVNAEKVDFERGGLRVTLAGVQTTVIAWDQVRSVTGRPLSDAERSMLAVAEDLWRARSRVQRGDLSLATGLLERHFADFRGTTSETALIVAEGLLRCRLTRDPMQAIVPAIEVARLRRAKVTTDRYLALPVVLDETTLLCPALAPTWPKDATSEAVAVELDAMLGGATAMFDPETRRVGEIYVALLRRAPLAATRREEGGVGLLAAMMELDRLGPSDTPENKTRVRTAVLAAAKGLGPWAGGWARYAVGRSLTEEGDRTVRMEGVLSLLEIPASRGTLAVAETSNAPAAPNGSAAAAPAGAPVPLSLVRAALGLAASTLRSIGDGESAAIVERELAATGGSVPTKPARPKAVKS